MKAKWVYILMIFTAIVYWFGYGFLEKQINYVEIYKSLLPEVVSIIITVMVIERLIGSANKRNNNFKEFLDDIETIGLHHDDIGERLDYLMSISNSNGNLPIRFDSIFEQFTYDLRVLPQKRIVRKSFGYKIVRKKRKERITNYVKLETNFKNDLSVFVKKDEFTHREAYELRTKLSRITFELYKLRSKQKSIDAFENHRKIKNPKYRSIWLRK